MNDWRTKARKRVKEKSSGSNVKMTVGDNCVRVMIDKKDINPDGTLKYPKDPVKHPPYREFRIHRDVGPDKAMIACGKDIDGNGNCWLCDVKLPELEASKNKDRRDLAYANRAAEQFLVNASRVDIETQEFTASKPWWISTGSGVPGRQGQSLATRIYSKISLGKKDFLHPVKGHNLNITRVGENLQTRYPDIEGDENPSEVPQKILATVKDLDALVPAYNEEDMKAAFFGKPRDTRKEDREDADRKRSFDKKRPPAKEVEEEEEEETEETEEELEEETEEETEETEEEESEEEESEEDEEAEEEEEEAEENEESEEDAEEEYEEAEEEEEEEEEEEALPPSPKKKKPAPAPAKKAPTKSAPPPPAKKPLKKKK